MPKAGGTGTRSSVRVAEKAALEAEQAAAVVDAETTAIGEGRSPSGRRRQLKTLLQWRALWWERCICGGARWW